MGKAWQINAVAGGTFVSCTMKKKNNVGSTEKNECSKRLKVLP